MNELTRRAVFFVGLGGLVGLLLTGLSGLPMVGDYRGPYGDVVNAVAVPERHVTDIVSAITFDYRGFDTLGEEFILFSAVIGVVVLLRRHPDEEEEEHQAKLRRVPSTSEAIRSLGVMLVGVAVLFGLYVVTHGQLTPGGGFQGGVILATVPLVIYLAGGSGRLKKIAPEWLVELGEAAGAGAFVVIGLLGVIVGAEFLRNVVPLGTEGSVISGGTIPLISLATGLEVSAGFVLLLTVFIQELRRRSIGKGR